MNSTIRRVQVQDVPELQADVSSEPKAKRTNVVHSDTFFHRGVPIRYARRRRVLIKQHPLLNIPKPVQAAAPKSVKASHKSEKSAASHGRASGGHSSSAANTANWRDGDKNRGGNGHSQGQENDDEGHENHSSDRSEGRRSRLGKFAVSQSIRQAAPLVLPTTLQLYSATIARSPRRQSLIFSQWVTQLFERPSARAVYGSLLDLHAALGSIDETVGWHDIRQWLCDAARNAFGEKRKAPEQQRDSGDKQESRTYNLLRPLLIHQASLPKTVSQRRDALTHLENLVRNMPRGPRDPDSGVDTHTTAIPAAKHSRPTFRGRGTR